MVKENNIDFHMNQMSCNIVNKLRKNGEPLNIIDKALAFCLMMEYMDTMYILNHRLRKRTKLKTLYFRFYKRYY